MLTSERVWLFDALFTSNHVGLADAILTESPLLVDALFTSRRVWLVDALFAESANDSPCEGGCDGSEVYAWFERIEPYVRSHE